MQKQKHASLTNYQAYGLTVWGLLRWSRLSEQYFRFDKWSLCQG